MGLGTVRDKMLPLESGGAQTWNKIFIESVGKACEKSVQSGQAIYLGAYIHRYTKSVIYISCMVLRINLACSG